MASGVDVVIVLSPDCAFGSFARTEPCVVAKKMSDAPIGQMIWTAFQREGAG
jgi:hypothetical protein